MRVDYELTSLGVGLLDVIEKIRAWADEHLEEAVRAGVTHDAADRSPAVERVQ
jgi:DNA-binding HxlR family transcriptional regulator